MLLGIQHTFADFCQHVVEFFLPLGDHCIRNVVIFGGVFFQRLMIFLLRREQFRAIAFLRATRPLAVSAARLGQIIVTDLSHQFIR